MSVRGKCNGCSLSELQAVTKWAQPDWLLAPGGEDFRLKMGSRREEGDMDMDKGS